MCAGVSCFHVARMHASRNKPIQALMMGLHLSISTMKPSASGPWSARSEPATFSVQLFVQLTKHISETLRNHTTVKQLYVSCVSGVHL